MLIRLHRVDDGYTVTESPNVEQTERPRKLPRRQSFSNDAVERVPVLLNASTSDVNSPFVDESLAFPYSGPLFVKLKPKAPEYPVIIPSYSAWFSLESIHENERRALPEFFEKKTMEKKYIELRNVIVNAYRANPRIFLTSTCCRQLLAVDACSVLRLHHFLETWGLINYNVDAGTIPVSAAPVPGTDVQFPIYSHSARKGATPIEDIITPPQVDFASTSAVLLGASSKGYLLPEVSEEAQCGVCQKDVGEIWYALKVAGTTSQGKLKICTECMDAGELPTPFIATDFEERDASSSKGSELDGWSTEETTKLLEAVEEHGESWDDVAEVVGRQKEECVEHFIKLPLEDPFLEQHYNRLGSKATSIDEALLPFADAANPIMAQVAFLTSMLSPAVGAAAAQTALASVEGAPGVYVKTQYGTGLVVDTLADGKLVVKLPGSVVTVPQHETTSVEKVDAPLNLSKTDLQDVARSSLASAATKANELADKEYRQMLSSVMDLTQMQMKKIETKMKHFDMMEGLLSKEKEHLEKCRQKLRGERLELAEARTSMGESTSKE